MTPFNRVTYEQTEEEVRLNKANNIVFSCGKVKLRPVYDQPDPDVGVDFDSPQEAFRAASDAMKQMGVVRVAYFNVCDQMGNLHVLLVDDNECLPWCYQIVNGCIVNKEDHKVWTGEQRFIPPGVMAH
jgi:hypothetical protein